MKKGRLTLQEANIFFPSFLKKKRNIQKIKKLTDLLYGNSKLKYVFYGRKIKRVALPIDLRRSYCYRGVSWFVWPNGINHRRICGKHKKKIYVFLCLNSECSEKFIDVSEKNNLYYFCVKCKLSNENDHNSHNE
jgi:hypothetical protein